MFLWYDEENDNFVELDTVLDEENSTVSVETTHFSKYMLVDQTEWFKAWKNASLYFEDTYEPLATVICYDCSGSMSSNDRTFNYNIFNDDGTIAYSYPTCYRKLAIDSFIDSMMLTDKTALVSFESSAKLVSGFSSDNDVLKSLVKPYNGGGTNARAALDIAISQLETVEHWYSRHVILLSDGDVNVTANQILQAKRAGIKIHTIGLGSGANNQKLQNCARDTGGQFFAAKTAEELDAIYRDLSKDNHFDLEGLPDEDGDGLPDEFEVSGLVISNAQVIYTDPENPDCDDDDLLDGQEISIDGGKSKTVKVGGADGGYVTYSTVVFKYSSDPNNEDTDGDGLYDDIDFDPIHSATEEQLRILEFFESAELFEIRYLADFCERFECSPIIAIDYINVYRRHDDYAIDEVIEDLASVGYKCDKAAFQIYYTEYFNYRNNTSFAQIMSENSSEWSYFFKIFMAEWVGGVTKQFLENCKEWDYSEEYKLSLQEEQSLQNVQRCRPITQQEKNVLQDIRDTYGNGNPVSKSKNVAYSNGKINNDNIDLRCVSGKNGKANFTKVGSNNYHYTGVYGETFVNHTEQDIIEYLYETYKNDRSVSGYINIVSERNFCMNCTSIIEQFEKDFPNIIVTWVFERI